ncbi:MAG: lycopene cyclase domain-containing protein [Candidatus Saccharimonadales bacterium]
MREFTYYLFNLLVFLPVLVLSFTTDVKPHRHVRGLLAGFLLVSVPFMLWDIWAAQAGHWGFNEAYITGPYLFGVPLEEYLFFITVPFAMIYVWGVVKKYVTDRATAGFFPLLAFGITAGYSVWLLVNYWGNGYTRSVAIAAIIAVLVAAVSRIAYTWRFWTFQVVLLGLFLVFNSLLTMLPIITYGPDAIIGFKIGDIPIEDFLFNFAFINLFLLVYTFVDQPRIVK